MSLIIDSLGDRRLRGYMPYLESKKLSKYDQVLEELKWQLSFFFFDHLHTPNLIWCKETGTKRFPSYSAKLLRILDPKHLGLKIYLVKTNFVKK